MTKNAPYITQENCIISRLGVGKVYDNEKEKKDKNSLSITGDLNKQDSLSAAGSDDSEMEDCYDTDYQRETGYNSTS